MLRHTQNTTRNGKTSTKTLIPCKTILWNADEIKIVHSKEKLRECVEDSTYKILKSKDKGSSSRWKQGNPDSNLNP